MSKDVVHAYVSGHGSAAIAAHSRRTVANSVPYLIPYLESARPNFVFLDVGCGPGSISLDIARQYPQATILGVDGSPEAIKSAQQAAQDAKLTNATFATGDSLQLDELRQVQGFREVMGDEGCDIVHAHQVLQHVPDALGMLKSMRAVARRDGGLVALREADWGLMTAWPSSRGIDMYHELFIKMARARGCDPLVARKMVGLAMQAGWTREEIESSERGWVYSTLEERQWWATSTADRWKDNGDIAKKALEGGFVENEQALHEVQRAWAEWAEKEDAWYLLPCPQIVCRNA